MISGILLLLGIGQRTVFAGPDEITFRAEPSQGVSYAVISAEQFDAMPGQANLVVGGANAFAAIGSTADVEAWVAPFDHAVLSADAAGERLFEEPVPAQASELSAEELEQLDPRGSDLWLSEQGPGRAAMSLGADQSVLAELGDGGTVSVVWVQNDRTPWAGPLLAAGGLFALIGAILYLLAVDHDRRGLGPRRGRSGPLVGLRNMARRRPPTASSVSEKPVDRARAKRVAAPVVGLSMLLVLSGCSSSYWPDLSPSPKPTEERADDAVAANVAPVPILQSQIDRVIEDVVATAGAGDDGLDAKLLEPRFSGDALEQRTAHYKIRKKVADYEVVLPRITTEQLEYELVQSTDGWPRTVFATVASEAPDTGDEEPADDEGANASVAPVASPSLALVLTQTGPHENYRVSRIFALRGGISMPSAAPVEEGTALLAEDARTLALPPGEVGERYAEVLAGGDEVDAAQYFDLVDDTIIKKSGAAWVAAAKKAAQKDKVDVRYSVKAAQTDTSVTGLSTGVGGALVATTVVESRIEKQTGDYQPKAVGAVTALSGLKGAQKQIVSRVAHQLLFFVPSETSGEKIQLLGYTTELVGASKK
ncbi:glycosyltransferase [Leucobacter soli]|uniref:glycosyltransferase n=1 Tax=Leucobacter soli TaxID=2812850 RepID=UPI001F3232EA|nr:glycosyltransferase [Leucobacter soli]